MPGRGVEIKSTFLNFVGFRGQDVASNARHEINTNVGSKPLKKMRQRTKHILGAVAIFLSSGLYFSLAYIGYNKQFIQIDTLDKYQGQVLDRGITVRRSGKYDPTVFYIRLVGLNETLGIYRMNGDYQGLINELKPGDQVTVYYDSKPNDDVNIDLVQIEKDDKIIVDSKEFKKKESALIYIGLIAGLLSVGGAIWYYKKYV
jgi:hypothetical protein